MIDQKINDLYQSIIDSVEYKKYLEVGNALKKNKKVTLLINNIKESQKKATKLQYHQSEEYLLVDQQIKEQLKLLNSYPIYIEYTNAKEMLNDILAMVTKLIEDYIKEKI